MSEKYFLGRIQNYPMQRLHEIHGHTDIFKTNDEIFPLLKVKIILYITVFKVDR